MRILLLPALAVLAVACRPKEPVDTAGQLDLDGDGVIADDDCNDDDATSYPGATEACDGVDNDCDGAIDDDADAPTWYADLDGDGAAGTAWTEVACDAPEGYLAVEYATDCDDLDPKTHPGAEEACDGVDNDCDGSLDEDSPDLATFYADADGDGHGDAATPATACETPAGHVTTAGDCDDTTATTHPGAVEICNGTDDDCDGEVDPPGTVGETTRYKDGDGDGFGDASQAVTACAFPGDYVSSATDCDDTNPAAAPGAEETCDGADNDCDGKVDDDATDATTWYADLDRDGYGADRVTTRACEQPDHHTASAEDCDDLVASVNPGASETCDGLDNDCDGTADDDPSDLGVFYKDGDGDGYGTPDDSVEGCAPPSGYVASSSDCDDTQKSVSPVALERCNGADDDCDGESDEDDAVNAKTWFADADGDGFGDAEVTDLACKKPTGFVADDRDCDDVAADAHPGADEVCDGVDNDCNGTDDDDDQVLGDAAECAAKDCKALASKRPGLVSGDFFVDPLGSGAFETECDLPAGWMVFHHDSESRYRVVGFESPSHVKTVAYDVKESTITAVLSAAAEAKQRLYKECYGSGIWPGTSGSSYTFWTTVAGTAIYSYWPGGSSACDINDNTWRNNGGDVTNKTHLPIKKVNTGDTGDSGEEAWITIGPLYVR